MLGGLGGLLVVLGLLIPSVPRSSDERLEALRRFSDNPHEMSTLLDQEVMPLLADLIDGKPVEAERLAFIPNSFIGDQTEEFSGPGGLVSNRTLRSANLRRYGPSAEPWLQVMFAWDDMMMAAISTDGLSVVDRDALIAAQQADFGEQLYQAELSSLGPVRSEITKLRWVRGIQMASVAFVPIGWLLVFVGGFVGTALGAAAELDRPPPGRTSGARHRDVADDQADAGGAHGQPVDVAADFHHVEQHALEGGSDGELADGGADHAIGDDEARSAD